MTGSAHALDRRRARSLAVLLGDNAPPPPSEVYFHADLGRLPVEDLRAERVRLLLRLALDPEPHWWFRQRLEAVEAELHAS